jgi:hypothetical protein
MSWPPHDPRGTPNNSHCEDGRGGLFQVQALHDSGVPLEVPLVECRDQVELRAAAGGGMVAGLTAVAM